MKIFWLLIIVIIAAILTLIIKVFGGLIAGVKTRTGKLDPLSPGKPLGRPVILEIIFPYERKVRMRVSRRHIKKFTGIHDHFHLFVLPCIFETGDYDLDIGDGFGEWTPELVKLILSVETYQELESYSYKKTNIGSFRFYDEISGKTLRSTI